MRQRISARVRRAVLPAARRAEELEADIADQQDQLSRTGGIWNKDREEEWLTEVQAPIVKA